MGEVAGIESKIESHDAYSSSIVKARRSKIYFNCATFGMMKVTLGMMQADTPNSLNNNYEEKVQYNQTCRIFVNPTRQNRSINQLH